MKDSRDSLINWLLALCLVWLELVRLAGRHQRHTASGARGTA